jgi:hypothetical protein
MRTIAEGDIPPIVAALPAVRPLQRSDQTSFNRFKERFIASAQGYAQRRISKSPTCVANANERLRLVFYLLDEGEDVGDALVGI